MDDSIAPVDSADGGDPIAAYRRYLEQNTGDRVHAEPEAPGPDEVAPPAPGAGPEIAPPVGEAPSQGAGPQVSGPLPGGEPQALAAQGSGPVIAPTGAPPASAQAAPAVGIGGAGPEAATPTLDAAMPSAIQGQAPQAPQADQAPEAKKATKASKARAARQAAQAPVIAPNTAVAPTPGAGPGPAAADITTDPNQVTPASGHVIPGQKASNGKPLLNITPPDHDPSDFDTDKLKNAHTAADVFDALPPGKQKSYMAWWEQQHGDIDDRYNAMLQDLGQRPDPNRDPTKKEKFTELMQFGLSLLQNAKRGNDPMAAMGASAQEAIAGQKQKQQQQTSDYDARVAGIQAQRNKEQADIGNAGNAVREDAMIQASNVRTATALKPPRGNQPTTRILSDGSQVEYDPETKSWNPSVDKNGKPLGKMPQQGPKGGAGKMPARMAEFNDLVHNQHVDPNEALNRVYGGGATKQLDPQKTYSGIYMKARGLGETQEDAATEAETITSQLHGGNWRAQSAAKPPTIPVKPPAVAPPIGKIGVDAQGRRWRNDGKGNAVLVTQ